MTFDISAYFRRVKETAATLQPYSDGGIYLLSLKNEQAGTVGGRIAVLSNRQVAATHIVNGTHQLATAEEIEAWKQTQRDKAQQARDEQMATQMRYNLVINAPGWEPGKPMPVDLAAATPAHSPVHSSGKRPYPLAEPKQAA